MLKRLHPSQWSTALAAHLLNRAGFGGTPAEISALQALGLERAVDRMVNGEEEDDLFPPPTLSEPAELFETIRQIKNAGEGAPDEQKRRELQQMRRREQNAQIRELRAWWLNRMRYTPFPLREKMTLFWHGHFATSFEKVNVAYMMWQQNETLRAQALGDFRELTKQVSKDPAMMRYLDTTQSQRRKPNENFARELMELFTLGEGVRYTEQDIQESARAFTGYRVDPRTMTFLFVRRQFDESDKEFMSRQGPFDGDDIIDIITTQPECAAFITRKLWTFFASDHPSPATLLQLATHFRNSGFNLRSTLREIFLSEEFYALGSLRAQVKSPIQWVVQTARVLESPLPGPVALEVSLAQMGQVPFAPPNVKGWDTGRAWISSSTLLFRYNLAGYIVSGRAAALEGFRKGSGSVQVPLEKIAPAALRADPGKLCDAISFRLLNAPIAGAEREKFLAFLQSHGPTIDDSALRDFLHLMMSTPNYQLT